MCIGVIAMGRVYQSIHPILRRQTLKNKCGKAFDLLDIIRNGAMKMKKLKVMIRALGFVA